MIHIDKLLVSMQHAMGKMAVANHLDGAMKVGFQPIGIHLGCCMSLCVYEHDARSTPMQPLLSTMKTIRDGIDF